MTRFLSVMAAASLAACAADHQDAVFLSAAECEGAAAWEAWTPYAVGDVVAFDGTVYQCRQAHTSQPDWTPAAVAALWTPGTCEGGGEPGPDEPDQPEPPPPPPPGGGEPPPGFVFGPYKDIGIHMNWNTNVISTQVPGTPTPLATDLVAHGSPTVTLAFATGECGSESWGGVPGAALAAANVPVFEDAGIDFMLSTGGAAGKFTCASDAGFETFLGRWASPNLVGVDLDIEAGQSAAEIVQLIRRIERAHEVHPSLRFSVTIATLGNNDGSPTARPMGPGIGSSLSVHGNHTMEAIASELGFDGTAATWPSWLTVNLMTMNYGAPGPGVCVVQGGLCQMGESAVQAAYNLHDHFGVPYANIELTPMIGGNDITDEHFTLADVDRTMAFALAEGLAGVHYWSYDRDVDCPKGPASPICNSYGGVGRHGFLERFRAAL